MKRTLLAAAAGLLLDVVCGAAQERPRDVTLPRLHFEQEFRLPDSLAMQLRALPEWEGLDPEAELVARPAVPMSSVVVIQARYLPEETMLLDNNTLRLGRHVVLSNGASGNWAPGLAGHLDARTISLPLP